MDVPGRSPKFTFESSVHSSHVLRSLEEQRQRDVLCDLTLLTAEGQSFRAHRSILVSCSEYFSQRIHSLSGQNTVITLPPEVTAAGFEPLLKFAYTSKLVFGKEDVLDIKTSVSSVPSHVDGSTSGWTCPKSSECERASQYGFSSLYSGEDSDIEVAEGYCDAYEQERAKQVQLPYPVDQMLKMSKTHFQQILDKNTLSQEQVELVRDLRRRSKNRLAAQRCRKRKLDCIYNLQCEINKLKTEREKLIQEKSQLSDLRLQACHRVSTICQSVCVGSNLPPEQIQLLFKYASAERPLASSVPIIDSLLSSSHPSNTQLHPSDAQDDFDCPSTNSNDS
uniref:Uncharacterized protein n=1 Tax=Knipowitschia caucasica TaxID=637954 RepID=A0AAV2JBG1_KNICA